MILLLVLDSSNWQLLAAVGYHLGNDGFPAGWPVVYFKPNTSAAAFANRIEGLLLTN